MSMQWELEVSSIKPSAEQYIVVRRWSLALWEQDSHAGHARAALEVLIDAVRKPRAAANHVGRFLIR
jgi:hypothetical protein